LSPTGCRASPSLALIKYWGKRDARNNTPATPSVAVTLGGLTTQTHVTLAEQDRVTVGDDPQPSARYEAFFRGVRAFLGCRHGFQAVSRNDFPTSAGLASSSSGFAALACACVWASDVEPPMSRLSELARLGSASAARAVWGGFVLLPRGARAAVQLWPPEHWPELRILAVITREGAKGTPTRDAMASTRAHSPYYRAWVRSSRRILPEALRAVADRDLERLGEVARTSSNRMHAVMLASRPPLRYWTPESVAVMDVCAELRGRGVGAWETLDAGPQVKVLCLETDRGAIETALGERLPALRVLRAWPGAGVQRV
jgi:diphosphomevalonate decarboxylase